MNYPIHIRPARHSNFSELPVCIALVDYQMLGTHEHANPGKVVEYLKSMLSHGYRGPAISVIEQHEDTTYYKLTEAVPTQITLSRYGELGVADGHHRLAAIVILDKLHLLKSSLVPVQLLPVRDRDIIKITTTRIDGSSLLPSEKPIELAYIESCFENPDKTIPSNTTTRFETRFHDRSFARVRYGQPDVIIDRSDFLEDKYNLDALAETVSNLELQHTDDLSDYITGRLVENLSELEKEVPNK